MTNFNNLKQSINRFDIEKIKAIIQEIEQIIKQKVGTIVSLIDEDNKEFSESITYSKIIQTIKQYKAERILLEKRSKNLLIEGIGNIAVIYNGTPDILLYLCVKAIKTHNNIIFFESKSIHKTSKYIIELVNKVLTNNNYKSIIEIYEVEKFNEIYNYEDYFNCFICIGEAKIYNMLKKNINKDIIYSAYGTLSLYMDDKNLQDILLQIDEYVFENNLKLDLYTDENIDNVLEKINETGENFCSIIFTKDIKKASYFIDHVNAKSVYVNKNPFNDYLFKLKDEEITREKRIII